MRHRSDARCWKVGSDLMHSWVFPSFVSDVATFVTTVIYGATNDFWTADRTSAERPCAMESLRYLHRVGRRADGVEGPEVASWRPDRLERSRDERRGPLAFVRPL